MEYPITPHLHLIARLAQRKNIDTKIVMLILDGLGGIASGPGGKTELETATTPHLDHQAAGGALGLHDPLGPGFTPGSGLAHLALFGYDPLFYEMGRGVLALFGARCFEPEVMQPGEVSARLNFCTVEQTEHGMIVLDRRAGRIQDGPADALVAILREKVRVPGVEIDFWHSKEHRVVMHLKGSGWSGELIDTDPQAVGVAPHAPAPIAGKENDPAARKTAEVVTEILRQAREALFDKHPANFILTRGFDSYKKLPSLAELTGMRCAAIAAYPDYRGIARLVGMDVTTTAPDIANRGLHPSRRQAITVADEIEALQHVWNDYDFFFVHVKKTDSYGEDGNFEAKARVIEKVDELLPRITALQPDVLCVTGDHSTPAAMKSHSFHPVPVLMSGNLVIPDETTAFGERACMRGGLGRVRGVDLLPLMMAYAGRLAKLGA